MRAESIFFYMMVTGLLLAPVAWAMTDFTRPVNWGADGPWLAAAIQLLNAIGALTLVYAFRYGQAIVVSPLTNAGAPLMTAVISLVAIGVLPGRLKLVGLALAQCELKHSIGSVERRPHRAINRASGDRAAPEHLNVSILEPGVHEDGDQVLAESGDVIQVRKSAGKPIRGGLLYCFQSGCGSRFQGSGSISGIHRIPHKAGTAEHEAYADAASIGRLL
jgi:hypothetical protein